MSRIDFQVSQSHVSALKLSRTESILNGERLEFREFAGQVTLNVYIDAQGNRFSRYDLARWTPERITSIPVIAATLASLRDAREFSLGMDVFYYKATIAQDAVTPTQPEVSTSPLTADHLMHVVRLLSNPREAVFFRGSVANTSRLIPLHDLDVQAMLRNGGAHEVMVKVAVGGLITYIPLTTIAPAIPVGNGDAFMQALVTLMAASMMKAFG